MTTNYKEEAFAAYIKYLSYHPSEGTDPVFDLEDALYQTEGVKLFVEQLKSIPEVNALFEERWLPAPVNLDELIKLPEGTLGHIYAREITKRGFNPNFYRTEPVVDDISYLKLLWRSTHDVHHVVARFDTDGISEIALQAFLLAQTPIPLSIALVSASLIKTFINVPENFNRLLAEIVRAYHLGANTPGKLIAQKWDQLWDVQVSEIRARLGLNLS